MEKTPKVCYLSASGRVVILCKPQRRVDQDVDVEAAEISEVPEEEMAIHAVFISLA